MTISFRGELLPNSDRIEGAERGKLKMETQMSQRTLSWSGLAAMGTVIVLVGCTQPAAVVASNPPPVPPGPAATWYHIEFSTASRAIGTQGEQTVAEVTNFLQQHPDSIATIIGKTDTVGSANYNMHLSHQRADAVRDALVYHGNVAADRVETRWTGETRLHVATANSVPEEPNRVVDIAIH
jgi:hypothetical protein